MPIRLIVTEQRLLGFDVAIYRPELIVAGHHLIFPHSDDGRNGCMTKPEVIRFVEPIAQELDIRVEYPDGM